MKVTAILTALSLALAIPTASFAADSAERAAAARAGKTIGGASLNAVNNQAAISCNFCFTCGGDWPTFGGFVSGSPDTPTERGSACSGALQSRSDASPFLCCN